MLLLLLRPTHDRECPKPVHDRTKK